MRFAFALALCSLSGCTLYFGNGDDEVCGGDRPVLDSDSYAQVRDPYTGQCYGGGGGGSECYYDDDCNYICYGSDTETPPTYPGDPREDSASEPYPQGAQCNSYCDSLSESACKQADQCQAAYDITSGTQFIGCWATDTTYPDAGGACPALDAYACSTRDDCTMNYDSSGVYPYKTTPIPPEPKREFAYCGTETGGGGLCDTTTCSPGYHCQDSCWDAGGTMDPSGGVPTCVSMCVPDYSGCAAIDCAPGYQCVDTCDVMTDAPMGGNGTCDATCVPTTSCESLVTQQACDARGDCSSIFDGDNCTCYENGYCECETLTWDRCSSGAMDL